MNSNIIKPFELQSVHLLESLFRRKAILNREYLLEFPPDRLLYTFYFNAGLPTNAQPLGGWEKPDCGVRGNFMGHFLSACARYFASDHDIQLKQKADNIISELAICQQSLGRGYLSAFPESYFDDLESGSDSIWAPYYVMHKLLRGLLDCYELCDNDQAFDIAVALANYLDGRLDKLSKACIEKMLCCKGINPRNEFAGVGEEFYRLYAFTGDERYLKWGHLFDRDYLLEPLSNGIDDLTDLHANTHLPMIISAAGYYETTGDEKYRIAVENFWEFLHARIFANGNSSGPAANPDGGTSEKSEHWARPHELMNSLTGGECESCCAFNTQELLEHLLCWSGDIRYADHIEQLMYNSVVNATSSINGLSQYHQPLGIAAKKKFSTQYDTFWCCTSSAVQAMSQLQKDIYFHDENSLFTMLYIPSELTWPEKGLKLTQSTRFPDSPFSEIVLSLEKSVELDLAFRMPGWLKAPAVIKINDELLAQDTSPGQFVHLQRQWNDGDVISIELPMQLRAMPLPDAPDIAAVSYGPILLAAVSDQQITLDDLTKLNDSISKCDTSQLEFVIQSSSGEVVKMLPIYRIEDETYSVYLKFGDSLKKLKAAQAAETGEVAY